MGVVGEEQSRLPFNRVVLMVSTLWTQINGFTENKRNRNLLISTYSSYSIASDNRSSESLSPSGRDGRSISIAFALQLHISQIIHPSHHVSLALSYHWVVMATSRLNCWKIIVGIQQCLLLELKKVIISGIESEQPLKIHYWSINYLLSTDDGQPHLYFITLSNPLPGDLLIILLSY